MLRRADALVVLHAVSRMDLPFKRYRERGGGREKPISCLPYMHCREVKPTTWVRALTGNELETLRRLGRPLNQRGNTGQGE